MTGMPPSVTLRRLPELVAGFASGAPDLAISDLTLDSRQVRPGTLFLACRGTQQHGLDFLPQALANGASALLRGSGMPSTASGGRLTPCLRSRRSRRRSE